MKWISLGGCAFAKTLGMPRWFEKNKTKQKNHFIIMQALIAGTHTRGLCQVNKCLTIFFMEKEQGSWGENVNWQRNFGRLLAGDLAHSRWAFTSAPVTLSEAFLHQTAFPSICLVFLFIVYVEKIHELSRPQGTGHLSFSACGLYVRFQYQFKDYCSVTLSNCMPRCHVFIYFYTAFINGVSVIFNRHPSVGVY